MSYLLSSITPRIRAALNDQEDNLYHDTTLLPYAQNACDELQMALELYGILVLEKKTSSPIVIPKNTIQLSYTSTPALPSDMLEPQRVNERLSGSTDMFTPMIARQWEPEILPTDSLRYWVYREQSIFFVGATSARDITIFYLKRLFNIATINDVVDVNNSQLYLINRIAAMAAADIGENPTRAQVLNDEASTALTALLRIGVKNKQRTRTRRRPFVLSGRRRWS